MNIGPYLGVAPLALAIALVAHIVRFGHEHAFGGRYGEGVVVVLVGGVLAGLTFGLWRVLSDSAPAQGALAAWSRLGLIGALGGLASLMFIGGELLEGPGPADLAIPIGIIAVASIVVASIVQGLGRWLRALVAALLEVIERVAHPRVRTLVPPAHCAHAGVALAYARFSRPPPRA